MCVCVCVCVCAREVSICRIWDCDLMCVSTLCMSLCVFVYVRVPIRHWLCLAMTGAGMDDFFAAVDGAHAEYEQDYRKEYERRRAMRNAKDEERASEARERLERDLKGEPTSGTRSQTKNQWRATHSSDEEEEEEEEEEDDRVDGMDAEDVEPDSEEARRFREDLKHSLTNLTPQ